ncbi:MAG: murein biosynthesis integral membrane protein MurJ, partial [Acidimicrobiia bacterium]|nr:murein biosynthesis integral membrane protein MurJ [Acidimicrobiia bacterium]
MTPRRRTLGMGGAAAVVSLSILASRLLGLLRETTLAALLGVSAAGDVYRDAFVIPDLLNYLLAGGFLSITLVPILARRLEAGEEREAWLDFSAVFRSVGVAIVVLTVLLWILAPWLVQALFPRLSPPNLATVVDLTRVALPAQVFFVLGALFMAVSYTQRRFFFPALAPVIYNLGIIGGGLVGAAIDRPTPHAFVWGAVAGAVIGNFCLQWLGARRAGLRWERGPSREAVRQYLLLAFPLMIGQSVAVLDEQFPRIFGQLAGEGGTAALSFARMLNMVPVGLIAQAAGVASYPFLARLAARGEIAELDETTGRATSTAVVAGMGATALLVATAQPAVRVVYQWGSFGGEDAIVVAGLLIIFSFSIPAWAIHQVVSRWFYANRRMWTPVAIGTAATALAIPIALVLAQGFGLSGVAWGSTAVMWLYTAALVGWWAKASNDAPGRRLLASISRALIPSVAAAVAGRWLVDRAGGSDPLTALPALVLGSVAVAGVFWGIGRILGVPELRRLRTSSP